MRPLYTKPNIIAAILMVVLSLSLAHNSWAADSSSDEVDTKSDTNDTVEIKNCNIRSPGKTLKKHLREQAITQLATAGLPSSKVSVRVKKTGPGAATSSIGSVVNVAVDQSGLISYTLIPEAVAKVGAATCQQPAKLIIRTNPAPGQPRQRFEINNVVLQGIGSK